jgi:soluble lytic murein transglycosylase-like protein
VIARGSLRLRVFGLFLVSLGCVALALLVSAARTEDGGSPPNAPAAVAASASLVCPLPDRFRPAFERAAADTALPLALLTAVARVESSFRHQARSKAGAQGLLQVMPGTARELALDPDQPETNVLAGARYLRQMLQRFDSTDLALAAYNAGPTAVERAGGAPTAEVLTYVANVTQLWRRLEGCT